MDKEMANAFKPTKMKPVGKLGGTGIKLLVTEKETGEAVNYGVQLNNTTLEIEALPNLKVEVMGYQDLYKALWEIAYMWREDTPSYKGQLEEAKEKVSKALAKVEGR